MYFTLYEYRKDWPLWGNIFLLVRNPRIILSTHIKILTRPETLAFWDQLFGIKVKDDINVNWSFRYVNFKIIIFMYMSLCMYKNPQFFCLFSL